MLNQDYIQLETLYIRDGVIDFETETIFQDLQAHEDDSSIHFLGDSTGGLRCHGLQFASGMDTRVMKHCSPLSINLEMKSDLGLLPDFNLDDIPEVNPGMTIESYESDNITLISTEKGVQEEATTVESKFESVDKIRLNYHQKHVSQAIKDVYRTKSGEFHLSFDEAYKNSRDNFLKEITRQHGSKRGSKSMSVITEKRCNETKYTRSLLRCFVAVASELLPYSDISALELYRDLETCTRVEQIHAFMVKPERNWFVTFLKQFLIPGHLMIKVIERLNNKPAISILLLEAMLVLQMMVQQPHRKFNTWKIEKLEIKGTYDEAIRKLKEGTASLQYVKTFVEGEYKKCQSKFKNRKCSDKNNITHFWVNLTLQMFTDILTSAKDEPASSDASSQLQNSQLEYSIKRGMELLIANESQESLLAAIDDSKIGEVVMKRFIKTNRLLEMILKIDSTNAMMIHNLITRYEWFIGQFRR